jgi:hypothetical protein
MVLKSVPCVLMRGGTSKGVFFKREDLPSDEAERDRVILKIFGSGDPMQIDGLGGTHSHTSKTMIVRRSDNPGVDVDYTFGQVGIETAFIDYTGNCGNLTSAVAPFAIDERLMEATEPFTVVRMINSNTGKRIDAKVPVENGSAMYEGDYRIDGVANPGARIDVKWHQPGGAVSGKLLPTGNSADKINTGVEVVEGSIVDASNPAVFVRAKDVGLTGTELPDEIDSDARMVLERIRAKAAEMMGLVKEAKEASKKSPFLPFVIIVGDKQDYRTVGGMIVKSNEYSLLARLFSLQKMHHAYAVTGAICTATAAKISKSVVNQLCQEEGTRVVIGHPKGLIDVDVEITQTREGVRIDSATMGRTARRLMTGVAYYAP